MLYNEIDQSDLLFLNNQKQFYSEKLDQTLTIQGRLGEGKSGRTYLVASEDQQYVLKVLKVNDVERWKIVERFEREFSVLSQLKHHHIPACYDLIKEDGLFGIIQEYIEGEDFASRIEREVEISEQLWESCFKQGIEILNYLRSFQPPIIHRDISPKNLMITPGGKLYLIDFGGVQVALTDSSKTVTTMGTFGYMAPEQIMGQTSAESDLYSFGVTMIAIANRVEANRLPFNDLTGQVDYERGLEGVPEQYRADLRNMIHPLKEKRALYRSTAKQEEKKEGVIKRDQISGVEAFSEQKLYSSFKTVLNCRYLWEGLMILAGHMMIITIMIPLDRSPDFLSIIYLNFQYIFYGVLLIPLFRRGLHKITLDSEGFLIRRWNLFKPQDERIKWGEIVDVKIDYKYTGMSVKYQVKILLGSGEWFPVFDEMVERALLQKLSSEEIRAYRIAGIVLGELKKLKREEGYQEGVLIKGDHIDTGFLYFGLTGIIVSLMLFIRGLLKHDLLNKGVMEIIQGISEGGSGYLWFGWIIFIILSFIALFKKQEIKIWFSKKAISIHAFKNHHLFPVKELEGFQEGGTLVYLELKDKERELIPVQSHFSALTVERKCHKLNKQFQKLCRGER